MNASSIKLNFKPLGSSLGFHGDLLPGFFVGSVLGSDFGFLPGLLIDFDLSASCHHQAVLLSLVAPVRPTPNLVE